MIVTKEIQVTDMEEILKRFVRLAGDCWEWCGTLTNQGYGQIVTNGQFLAHRYIFTGLIGDIGGNLVLDHICENRRCVYPHHLEPMTHKQNTLKGNSASTRNARKTHCPSGHEYSEENTRVWRGIRHCRTCRAALDKRRRGSA